MPFLTRRRARLTAVLAAGAVALPLAACSSASSGAGALASAERGVPTAAGSLAALRDGDYVALGDSYTAGPDIPGPIGRPAGCGRSSRSYPFLIARALGVKLGRVRDMSCTGATIADLAAAQQTSDGTNPAQLTALSAATSLVTVGIGGNDIGFAAALTRCVELDSLPVLISKGTSGLTPCQDYYTSSGSTDIRQLIQDAGVRLAAVLTEIRLRAPEARVYVIGYPALMPADTTAGCSLTLAITQGDLAFINGQERQLNDALRERATAAGDVYVDTYSPSADHDACTAPATRWAEPLLPSSAAAPLHPNATGEQEMAEAVIRAIRGRS